MSTKLGQNFLINREIVNKIIKSANLNSDDLVLEIGPGKGILTEELAKRVGRVMAVEIDSHLVSLLRSKLQSNKNVEIVEENILKLNVENIFCHSERGAKIISRRSEAREGREAKSNKLELDSSTRLGMTNYDYKVIANLPYYITSPIIRKFLEADLPPSEMILMVQKEVAERICAVPSEIPTFSRGAKRISRGKPGKMSILAVSVQYYARPEILFYVEKGNFDPVPEVDSAVIKIVISHQSSVIRNRDFDKEFFRVVRAGFCAKRKTLANNLANSFHLEKKEVEEKLEKAGINSTVRAQELSVEDWKKLVEYFG
jgi:16S rRNA (adenine1518-N6/adenine1519-N6)-dimethyltransferase